MQKAIELPTQGLLDAPCPLLTSATTIRDVLISNNESDRNLEPANVVDGLFAIARALERVAVALREREPVE
jgi:hypothetical protein